MVTSAGNHVAALIFWDAVKPMHVTRGAQFAFCFPALNRGGKPMYLRRDIRVGCCGSKINDESVWFHERQSRPDTVALQ